MLEPYEWKRSSTVLREERGSNASDLLDYLTLTKNLSGNLIDVGNAKEGRINPFHIYKILTEDGTPADPIVTFNTHLKMLESFFKIVLVGASTDVIELINNLTVEMYERKGITELTDCTNFKAKDFPLFTDLLKTLQNKDKTGMDALTLRDMRTAELYLQKFVNGRYSDIWNGYSTLETSAGLIDFNFQSLFANKNNVVANAQMLLIFRFIEQEIINARELNKNGKNLRTLIVCDEAHCFIDPKFPIALDFFFSMSKRIRKYNGAFIPATQNIADWNANEELRGKTSAILKNSQYTFIFKISAPDMKDVLDIYKAGDGFNADEQRMIISAVTGQMFFIGSTELRTCVRIIAGDYAKELFDENKKREGNNENTYGIYEFYAVDKSGLQSATHYVFLDNLPPFAMLFAGENMAANGTKTNAEYIKYSASDMGAGIKGMYVKRPNESMYASYTSGSQCVVNGTYSFYATDNVGLSTATVTITLDNVAPILTCSQTEFYSTYDCDFTVTASDAVSNFTLYYKTPSMTDYAAASGNSYTVDETWSDGKYYFYAEDELGNATSYMWIELSVALPEAQIIKDESLNRYKITWSDDGTGKLNGSAYTKNTWITAEGDYTFVLTSTKQRVSTYSFAITHVYDVASVLAPTCLEYGYTTYQCKSCTSTYNADYIDAIGHNYEETVVEVGCTTDGGTYHVCLNCGDEYVTDKVIALGHIYEQTTIAPTCTEGGCKRSTCARCEYSYDTESVLALGHIYESEVRQVATCTTSGNRFHICERCGDNYTTDIPYIGHNYEISDVENDEGTTIRTYSCLVCGHSYTQDLGNQYEEVSNYVEYLFNQYSPYMIWVFLATSGVWSVGMGVAFIVAQKNEDKAKAKKMLVNYGIGIIIIFGILVAAPYLVRGIAALITG